MSFLLDRRVLREAWGAVATTYREDGTSASDLAVRVTGHGARRFGELPRWTGEHATCARTIVGKGYTRYGVRVVLFPARGYIGMYHEP